ncbi:hypothetical protein ABT381_31930, partial [Streptomyces sp. NPDC000151]
MNVPGIGIVHTMARTAASALGSSARPRTRIIGEQAHIAVRGLREAEEATAAAVTAAVERRLVELPAVRWAAVNAVLGYAVVVLDGSPELVETAQALTEAVETVEEEHGLTGPLPEHPFAPGDIRRAALSLALQAAAVPVATAVRLSRRTPLPVALSALVTVVDTQPALRRKATAVVGARNVDVVLAGLSALAQAGAGGLPGLGVDAVRHALRLAETVAHRDAWEAAAPRIAETERHARAAAPPGTPREVPLREGPVERYARRAGWVAGTVFAGTLAVTRRPTPAASATLATVPKPPWAAREAFAGTLGRGLSLRGTLVADPGALRRLDRVGTVVLDTDALLTGGHLLADLAPLDPERSTGDLAATAYRLFDGKHPTAEHEDDGWSLAPLRQPGREGASGEEAAAAARLRGAGAQHILALTHDGRTCALIAVVPELHEAAEGLVTAGRRSGLTVLAAGAHADHVALSDAHGTVPGGDRLAAAVRDAQRDGTGVLLLSRDRAALAAADVGVGVTGRDGVLPWGADLYVGDDLAQAAVLVAACGAARPVSQRGVRLAQAAAVVGAVATLAGRRRRGLAARS